MMINLLSIDHIVLNTYDKFDDMIDFYCHVLKCQVEREVKEAKLTQLRAGHSLIDLVNTHQSCPHKNADSTNLLHFCLTMEGSINDTLIDYLRKKNISVSNVNVNYGAQGFGHSIYITDPCGNIVELKQHENKSI